MERICAVDSKMKVIDLGRWRLRFGGYDDVELDGWLEVYIVECEVLFMAFLAGSKTVCML